MDIIQLTQFKTIADKGSISKAADVLHISQSGLSKSIQRLEHELHTELFIRTSSAVVLTEIGQRFLRHVEVILSAVDDALADINSYQKSSAQISLACCSRGIVWYISALTNTHGENYTIIPNVYSNASKAALELKSGITDLAIMPNPGRSDTIDWIPYFTDRPYICVPENSPFAQFDSVSIEQLRGETFAIQKADNYWSNYLRRKLADTEFINYTDTYSMYSVIGTKNIYGLTTEIGEMQFPVPNGKKIPLIDEDAFPVYYLGCLKANRDRLQPLIDLILTNKP